MTVSNLEQVLRRDRFIILIVLGMLTLLSWAQMVLPNDGPRGGEPARGNLRKHGRVLLGVRLSESSGRPTFVPDVSPMSYEAQTFFMIS